MKKLIALSLAAASSLVMSNAMALPRNIALQADGGHPHPATCYLIENNGGVNGSCDYECDIAGPYDRSPTLSVYFTERKVFMNTQCDRNEGHFVQTYLAATDNYCSEVFDQWDYRTTLEMFAGSESGGMAVLDSSFLAVGLSIIS